MSLLIDYSFTVSYHDSKGIIKTGFPQTFRYERDILFVFIYSENDDHDIEPGSEFEWIRADACTCIEIFDIYALQKLIKGTEITLGDLETIRNFAAKYSEEVSG